MKNKDKERWRGKTHITDRGKNKLTKTQDSYEVLSYRDVLHILPFVLYAITIPLFKYSIEYVWSKILISYATIGLVFIIGIIFWFKESSIKFFLPKTLFPLSIFLLFGILSALWAYNPYKTRNVAVMIGPGILAYFAVLLFLKGKKEEFIVLTFASAFASVYVAVYGLLQYYGFYPMPQDQYGNLNPITTFGLSNFANEYLVTVLPLMLVTPLIFKNSFFRAVMGMCSLLVMWYIIITFNRAGWLGMITGVLFISLLYFFRRTRLAFSKSFLRNTGMVALISILIISIFLYFHPFGKRIVERFGSFFQIELGSSVATRILAWRAGFEMLHDNPLGVGGGNYEIYSWKYAPRLLDEATIITNTRVDKAHNEFVQIFCDLGLFGFFVFVLLLLTIFKIYLEIFRNAKDDIRFWIGSGVFSGIFACLVASSFTFALQWPGSVTHFWYIVGFLELVRASVMNEKHIDIRKPLVFPLALIIFIFLGGGSVLGFIESKNLMLAEIHYRFGQMYKRARQWETSLAHYLTSLKYENPAERTFYDLAYLYLGKDGDIGKTIGLLKEASKYVPYFGKGRKELGTFLLRVGQVNEAIKELESALDSNPANTAEIYSNISLAYSRLGDWQKTEEYAMKSIEDLKISHPQIKQMMHADKIESSDYQLLGFAYSQMKMYSKAEEAYLKALEIEPENPKIKANYAEVLLNVGRATEAVLLLQEVENSLTEEKPLVQYNLAAGYALLGNRKKALEYLKNATNGAPYLVDKAMRDPAFKNIKIKWK